MGFGAGAAARPLALGAARAGAAEEAEQARTLAVLAPAGMGGRRPPPPPTPRCAVRSRCGGTAGRPDRRRGRTAPRPARFCEIGRANVWTPVTNAPLVCRLLLEKKKN